MLNDPNGLISLINPRGRVTMVRLWEVAMLKTQGWRIINNPKEDYYPQFDQTLTNHFVDAETNNDHPVEVEDSLEYEDV